MLTDVRVFACPGCNETINTSMTQCSFCHRPVDHAAAEAAAATMARINEACSDASYLKIMAGMIVTFFLLRFVPILGLIGTVGLLFLFAAIPVMTIRWYMKFGRIQTADPDFLRARKTVLIVAIVTVAVLVLAVGVFFFFSS